ncbi:MAG: thiamine-phosphate kinase [Planctomycetes bacterium]|nr:thiamine-phosphate kinase [Planctomycetota bacterium]
MNEFEFIGRLANMEQHRCPLIQHGIGDDCAVFDISGQKFLITTDTLVEDVHFDANDSAELVGRKILAVSMSDIAAMGGKPMFAVVTSSMSGRRFQEKSEIIIKSIFQFAKESEIQIVGGDITGFTPDVDGMVFTLTLIGVMNAGFEPALRKTAQVGDLIVVTGNLGGSYASKKHLNFEPRIKEGIFLAEHGITSMIDISDGLSGDLGHILADSNVGAQIYEEKLPISEYADKNSKKTGKSAWVHALNDGEDFELLFTIAKEKAQVLESSWNFDVELSNIGEIMEKGFGYKIQLANGQLVDIKPESFDHFKH